jgi:hypothetical protein
MMEAITVIPRRHPVIASTFSTSGRSNSIVVRSSSITAVGPLRILEDLSPGRCLSGTNPGLQFGIQNKQCVHNVVELHGGRAGRLAKFPILHRAGI